MAKSLNTEFVKYYKDKLESYGFKKVKGRQPYFVRIINDEILHIFTFTPRPSLKCNYDNFWLLCGVATVYKKEINFSVAPSRNMDWLVPLVSICERKDSNYLNHGCRRDFKDFFYNEDSINEALVATDDGAKIILSELDKVKNMDDALSYFLKYNVMVRNVTFQRWNDDSFFDEESLYYARREYDYDEKMKKVFDDKRLDLKKCNWSEEEKKATYEGLFHREEEMRIARDKILNSDYEQAMRLLKERYYANVDSLKGYGLDIKRQELEF